MQSKKGAFMGKKQGAFRTTIGGQALIEGILMRGPEKQAIVAACMVCVCMFAHGRA